MHGKLLSFVSAIIENFIRSITVRNCITIKNKTDDNTEKNFVSAGDDVHRSVRLRTGNG